MKSFKDFLIEKSSTFILLGDNVKKYERLGKKIKKELADLGVHQGPSSIFGSLTLHLKKPEKT